MKATPPKPTTSSSAGDTAAEVAQSLEAAKEAIRQAAGFTKFTTDTSRLFQL